MVNRHEQRRTRVCDPSGRCGDSTGRIRRVSGQDLRATRLFVPKRRPSVGGVVAVLKCLSEGQPQKTSHLHPTPQLFAQKMTFGKTKTIGHCQPKKYLPLRTERTMIRTSIFGDGRVCVLAVECQPGPTLISHKRTAIWPRGRGAQASFNKSRSAGGLWSRWVPGSVSQLYSIQYHEL